MAVWSKALQLTASCLAPLPGFEYYLGHVRKLGGGFRWVLRFPPPKIQLASHDLAATWPKK